MHVLAMLEMHSAKELNGCHVHHVSHSQQQHQTRPHRQRPRSKELQYSHESLDGLDGAVQAQLQQRHPRYHHHHHHHHQQRQQQQQQQRYNHVQEQEERDDTEDNLADEEFEDDEVGRDVRQKRLQKPDLNHKRADGDGEEEEEVDADDDEDDDEDEEQDQDHRNGGHKEAAPLTNGSMRGLEANVINDELKYGAAHLNHQSMDSNPLESQSEWSDDDCREEATGEDSHGIPFSCNKYTYMFCNPLGGAESTGYITDEPGLENISLLNEAGLTDAEGALSDVNSLYNAPDVDDTSVSSRASSRLLSLDSLSGLYDCDLAIVNASHKISSKFGQPPSPAQHQQHPQQQQQQQQHLQQTQTQIQAPVQFQSAEELRE